MDFRGHLRLPEDAGTGIPVVLRLEDIFLVITSDGDELGVWRADDVAIERIFSNLFSIELDGEPMVFIAQDALGFAYDGIAAIEDLQERLTKRRRFRGKKKAKTVESAVAPEPVTAEPVAAEPVTAPPAIVETPPAAAAPEQPAAPDEETVPVTIEAKPIWAPPSGRTSPAPLSPPVVVQVPEFHPVVPEPVQRQIDDDESAEHVADERVSYGTTPVASPAEAPEERHFDPPVGEPDPVPSGPPVVPVAEEPVPPPQPWREVEVADEPEYEIEEVAQAASGALWDDEVDVVPAFEEPEIEIEEYVLPAAGAADTFSSPVPVPAEPQAIDPVVPAVEEPAAEVVSPIEAEREVSEAVDVEESMQEVPAGSNGHGKADKLPAPADTRERRHSLFGRSRDKKVAPHDHQYGEPKTIGGLTRQVCEVCGHVTFSGEDVYHGW